MKDLGAGKDPEFDPKLMGWGDRTLQPHQNLAMESRSIQYLSDKTGIVCSASAAEGASKMSPKMDKLIRSFFKFDSGWDTMVAERMLYKLTPEQTLMVTQNIGNCVGDSHCCLVAGRIAHEVFAIGEAEEPFGFGQLSVPFIAYSYGAGRLVGGMINSRGDGSYCGAQMEGSQEYGYLPCSTPGLNEAYGESSMPQGSAKTGRKFGSSKSEIEKWKGEATKFDLLEAPVCKTVDDAIMMIEEKQIGLQICSGTMPGRPVYDKALDCYVYTGWTPASHSTQIVTSFKQKGRQFFVGRNQWGYGAHKGAPSLGIPGGCYVFPAENLASWLKRAECIGVGSIQGIPQSPKFV
jgi:hypothetical protein